MTEPEPSRLAKLRAVAEYLAWDLRRVQQSIADEETRLAREQPATSWRIEHIRAPGDTTTGHGILHTMDCPVGAGPAVSRSEAVVALTETSVMPCPKCRPEVGLDAAERPTSSEAGRLEPPLARREWGAIVRTGDDRREVWVNRH